MKPLDMTERTSPSEMRAIKMNFFRRIPVWLLIFLTAYAVRLAYIIEISDRPYFTAPAVDAEYHDVWASEIAGGKLFRDEPFFRAPLYPYFLGAVYAIFGRDFFIVRIIQALVGSLTAVLVYLLGKRLFSPRVGAIAGFAAALTGIIIYFEGELLIPVLLLPLDLGLIMTLLAANEKDRGWKWWLAGLLLGLSAIARPNILVIIPIIIYLIFKGRDFKRGAGRLGLALLGFIIPLAPVTYHNLKAGEFVLIATQGGVNFYIGNNPGSRGAESSFPGLGNTWRMEDAISIAEDEAGKQLSSNEISRFYYRKGLDFIVSRPLEWFRLLGVKALMFLSRIEISNNKAIYFSIRDSAVLMALMNLGFCFYGPLGILGLGIFYRKMSGAKIISWFVILYSFSVLLFFVTSRYRLPMVPFLIIFAVAAAEWLTAKIKGGEWRRLLVPAAVLTGLAILVNINFFGLRKIHYDYAHFSLGNAYHKKGQLDMAEEHFRKALEANPYFPLAHLNLGVVQYERGDFKAAEREFVREMEINRGLELAYAFNNLGNIRVREGHPEDALYFYRRALTINPNAGDARVNLAKVLSDEAFKKVTEDSLALAAKYLKEAVEILPGRPISHHNFALVLGELGREEEALYHLNKALEIDPEFQPAKDALENYRRLKEGGSYND